MTDVLNDAANEAVLDSSGNVFTDLNLPSSEEDMFKIEISRAIAATIRRRNLTQVEAAKIIGADQAKVSAMLRGRLKDFSSHRLMHYLVLLGINVDVHLSSGPVGKPGRVKVSQAA